MLAYNPEIGTASSMEVFDSTDFFKVFFVSDFSLPIYVLYVKRKISLMSNCQKWIWQTELDIDSN